MIEKYPFEEFKLMYESTEKVTERRLTNNKQNYTISVAILVGIAIVWKWGTENTQYFFGAILLVFVISIFATFFCSFWIEQIKDFKKLNDAKFFVINQMAKNLYFESKDAGVLVVSYNPFKKEWDKLKQTEALINNKTVHLVALKSSWSEFFIPRAFRVIFLSAAVVSTFVSVVNISNTWLSIQNLLHIK